MQKKAFTLVELIIVILVMGLLVLGFKGLFQGENREFLKAQTCFNQEYGNIRDFFDSAVTSRGLYSGNTLLQPERYIINFDTGNSQIKYSYVISGVSYDYKKDIVFQQKIDTSNPCFGAAYLTSITGATSVDSISLSAGLGGSINNPGFVITGSNGDNIFTGAIVFRSCTYDNKCRDVGRLIIDKRVGTIMQDRCLQWNYEDTNGNQYCKESTVSNQ